MFHLFDATATVLDLPTLLVIATWMAALLGLFLFLAWVSDRTVSALAWWSAAYLIGGFAVAQWIAGGRPATAVEQAVPSALLFLALGMVWTGARLFYGRAVLPLPMMAGALVWLAIARWPSFVEGSIDRLTLSSIGIAIYAFLTAVEVWRDRRAGPNPGWRALVVPSLHASVFLLPVALPFIVPGRAGSASQSWFTVLTLATLLYAVGTAFLILALVQDRSIRLHKDAASTDPLTGLLNRRAFLDYAQRLIARHAQRGRPVTLLMFDLDHFKSINDRFGHAVGDEALRLFASTAAANMRADDAIGRLGGEEFAAVVPGGGHVAAGIAERIRTAFETAGAVIAGHAMGATVSIGAAWTAEDVRVDAVLAEADAALYRAKESGRNRLMLADVPVCVPAPAQAEDERERVTGGLASIGPRRLQFAQRLLPAVRVALASIARTRSTISPANPR